ncbi:MAG: Gfo/Idh/MocA family oxidoreductase [Chloroflexota bacterium]
MENDTISSIEATDYPSVAVIGCGYWGKNHVRNFRQLGALSMVCDLTEIGRQQARELAPGVAVTGSVQQVLNNPSVSGVIIATPAETHFDLVNLAIEAGKDVLVEKPLALTFAQGLNLVEMAQNNQRILSVGHILEYHPAIVRLQELIQGGALGKIHYIYSNRLSLGKIRHEENILWSFAPHDVAVILRLMNSLPFEVSAFGGSYIQPNIADVTVTNMLFDNGVRAHIHVSWLHPFKEQRLVVIGSKKMASFDDVAKELVLYDQRVDIQEGMPVPIKGEGETIDFVNDEPLRLECVAFLEAIQSRHPPITDGGSGARVLQVLEAAQRSLVTNGQPVAMPTTPINGLPPQTIQFA